MNHLDYIGLARKYLGDRRLWPEVEVITQETAAYIAALVDDGSSPEGACIAAGIREEFNLRVATSAVLEKNIWSDENQLETLREIGQSDTGG